jgi:cytoskeletal protein RodZ
VRRILAFGLAWLCAAVVAVVVAWQGVGVVGDQVTSDRPATLSSSEVEAALRDTATDPSSSRSDGTTSTTPPGVTPAQTTPAPGSAPATPTTPSRTATTATRVPATSGGGGGNTGDGAAAPTVSPAENRTFLVSGGTVELRFAPEGTTLVYATPNAGYQITRNGPADNNGWRVEFEGPAGKSRIEGWWDGGPKARVEDDAASGGPGAGAAED